MENRGLTSGLQSSVDADMSSPADGNTISEVLDYTAHELVLFPGSGQRDPHLQSSNVINPENASVNHETMTFFQHPPQPGGVSNTSRNDTDVHKRQLKRDRDSRYRQKAKESRFRLESEIEQLTKQNAILQEGLSNCQETQDHLERHIGRLKERLLLFEDKVQQLGSTLDHQPVTAEAGTKDVDLEQRYEESKLENILLKKQLKKEKRQKKVMEKALLERIIKLESMEKEDIEPSSSYMHSEHSNV